MGHTIKELDLNHDGTVDMREMALGMKNHVYSANNPEYQEALRLYARRYPYMERGAAGVELPERPERLHQWARRRPISTGCGGVSASTPPIRLQIGRLPGAAGDGGQQQVRLCGRRTARRVAGSTGAIAFAIPITTAKHGHLAQAVDFLQYLMSYSEHRSAGQSRGVDRACSRISRTTTHASACSRTSAPHLSPLAFAEETFPPQWTVLRQQLLIDYLTGQKSWTSISHAMQRSMDSTAVHVLTTYHLK